MEKKLRKAGIIIDRTTDNIITLLCLFMFLIGIYRLYDFAYMYNSANDRSTMRFKPDYSSDEAKISLPDSVAWLVLEDTTIDYPIMQGKDNIEYINKDPYGKYSLAGSIFLDTRNSPDFTDDYNLIYGHHMESGMMFGSLDKYFKEGYLDEHRDGVLVTKDSIYRVNVFAAFHVVSTNHVIFDPGDYSVEEVMSLVRDKAEIYREPEEGCLLALSTCTNNLPDNRTIVMCTIDKPLGNM